MSVCHSFRMTIQDMTPFWSTAVLPRELSSVGGVQTFLERSKKSPLRVFIPLHSAGTWERETALRTRLYPLTQESHRWDSLTIHFSSSEYEQISKNLPATLPSLRHLQLAVVPRPGARQSFLSSVPNLETLELFGLTLEWYRFRPLHLERLRLSQVHCTIVGWARFLNFLHDRGSTLEVIEIDEFSIVLGGTIHADAVRSPINLPTLRTLRFVGVSSEDYIGQFIQALIAPLLEEMAIGTRYGWEYIQRSAWEFSHRGWSGLALPSLKRLCLHRIPNLTSALEGLLPRSPNLDHLAILGCLETGRNPSNLFPPSQRPSILQIPSLTTRRIPPECLKDTLSDLGICRDRDTKLSVQMHFDDGSLPQDSPPGRAIALAPALQWMHENADLSFYGIPDVRKRHVWDKPGSMAQLSQTLERHRTKEGILPSGSWVWLESLV